MKHKQQPPHWGVMFRDGSVVSRWNGRTQLHRAILARDKWATQFAPDLITLAYRKGPGLPWVRVVPNQQGESHESPR